jgi:hypothetical protein
VTLTNTIGRNKPTLSFVVTPGSTAVEIVRHSVDTDLPRVLHVWATPGQYHPSRPFIRGHLFNKANGIVRKEYVQIPWSGRAFEVLPGEVWIDLAVDASATPLPDYAEIFATISPGNAAAGECLSQRADPITGPIVCDAEDPNTGCLFATALILSGQGAAVPYTVTYPTGTVANGSEGDIAIDWRSKVTVAPVVGCSTTARWRFFR